MTLGFSHSLRVRGETTQAGYRFSGRLFCSRLIFGMALSLISLSLVSLASATHAQDQPGRQLSEVIDASFADDQPPARTASDAEFARRVSLDLTGMPLSAERLQRFLDNPAEDKRDKLVDELIQSPRFERRLATFLDILLMERRANQDVPEPEWTAYLLDAVRQNKPWNILAREILSADGIDEQQRPAVRFYLARDGEPNLLTRDIGRIFFGRDLQCAQCHNHPLVDDYLQSDYQGLLAFVAPGYIKSIQRPGPPTKEGKPGKPVSLKIYAEKDGNDIQFESVFVKDTQHRTGPRLIGETAVVEPDRLPVATTTTNRPENSRRAVLATAATDGTNRAFNENIANRLWGMMMGHGLVDPPDFHHRNNPPIKPGLMKELGRKMVEMNFDLRAFVREIALSKVYQRAYELPALDSSIAEIQSRLPALEKQKAELEAAIAQSLTEYEQVTRAWSEAEAQTIPVSLEIEKAGQSHVKLSDEASKLKAAFDAAQQAAAPQTAAVQSLTAAVAPLQQAQDRVSDPQLAELQQQLAAKLQQLETRSADAMKKATEAEKLWQAKQQQVQQIAAEIQQKFTHREPLRQELARREAEFRQSRSKLEALMVERSALGSKITTLEKILAYQELANQLDPVTIEATSGAETPDSSEALSGGETRDGAAAEGTTETPSEPPADIAKLQRLEDSLAIRLSRNHVVSSLRPLTPEQLCWSILQVTGVYQRTADAEANQLRKELNLEPNATLNLDQQRQVEARTDAKLKGHLNQFIRYYAAGAGQPQGDFFATADQALFAANSGSINSYVNPAAGNVTQRVLEAQDHDQAAEELYLAILSRRPTAEEITDVANYLQLQDQNRRQAAIELVWALINSAEFRFNH